MSTQCFSAGVVSGHKNLQTHEAKWLCIENIHQKFYRPNFYDIGGTYNNDVADHWFLFKTESMADVFLLHLFVCNNQENSFSLSASASSTLRFVQKDIAHLSLSLKKYQFNPVTEKSQTYIMTYNFTEFDVDLLKDKKLYIPISFQMSESKQLDQHIVDEIKLKHDLRKLLNSPTYTDFTIESSDGEKFKVHKLVLRTYSEFFQAMLKDDTAESQNSYVKLFDTGKKELHSILEFIYTGTVHDLEKCNLVELLKLADQYNLRGLLELIQYALCAQITKENVLDTFMIADMYNSDILKTAAMNFFKTNAAVIHSSVFK